MNLSSRCLGFIQCLLLTAVLQTAESEPSPVTPSYKQAQIPKESNPHDSLSSIASIFSPRMDFEQWKPLTGRGDPLRNDPTYDYEPPMLEKVHYWADDTRFERERYPEKKSEVLVLGVSSRKPSVSSRPLVPPKRHTVPPVPKYEDFTYKFNGYYPITILVPPPPPPAGYKPSIFVQPEKKHPRPTPTTNVAEATLPSRYTISTPELITSFALQEANLIYEATDNNQTWFVDYNKTQTAPINTVSSDYAGWGPTTPLIDQNTRNDFHNLIPHRESAEEFPKNSYVLPYHDEFSQQTSTPKPTFLPTSLPPQIATVTQAQETLSYEQPYYEVTTESQINLGDGNTEEITTNNIKTTQTSTASPQTSVVDMLGGMMSMPMVTDPDRPEDNLYAHASENIQVFKDSTDDIDNIEVMQTMQPPPLVSHKVSLSPQKHPYHINPHVLNSLLHEKPSHTHDPYLHMRYTTPLTPTSEQTPLSQDNKPTTESLPMYLIIQGHSKVKTYGSKPKPASNTITNGDILKPYETNEVKHLHPLKDKYQKRDEIKENVRSGRTYNLTSLIDSGIGSIEIQETDVGIKYDVSDGSKVPIEIYRKGIVESGEINNYSNLKKNNKRSKRQVDLSDLIPFDEDTLEDMVYNFFETRKNTTGLTGFIAKAITGDVATAVRDAFNEDDEDHSYRKR